MTTSLAEQAAACRAQAAEFAGKPEQPLLLRISEAFDELAHRHELIKAADEGQPAAEAQVANPPAIA